MLLDIKWENYFNPSDYPDNVILLLNVTAIVFKISYIIIT